MRYEPFSDDYGLGTIFTNTNETSFKAVKVRFQFQDAFGATLGTQELIASGTFANGVKIDREDDWSVGALLMGQYYPRNMHRNSNARDR